MRRLTLLLALAAAASGCAVGAGVVGQPGTTTLPAPPRRSIVPAADTSTDRLPVVEPATTSTTAAPTTTTTTQPPRGRLVIHGVGDVNLDPTYIRTFDALGYEHAWTGLNGLFQNDDLTIVNLECAASELGTREIKQFTFRCDTQGLQPMADAGVDVASLANNHARDFGPEALIDSRQQLLDVGIEPVGAGRDIEEATRAAVYDINGWRVAVIGLGGVVEGPQWHATETNPGMADGDDIEKMVAAVQRADRDADLVFVTIHWGTELDLQPRQEDIARAKAMIDAGADGIFGHHQHRLQGLEFYEGRPIAWGLGNFVWPRLSDASSRTAVAEFIVEPDGTIEARLIPAFIESDGHPVLRD